MHEPSEDQKVEATAVILWDELKQKERDSGDAECPPAKDEDARTGTEKGAPAGKHPPERPE
jgi:hypothetical protein